MKYGVYPFWFWNGLQEENEIERQLKLMHSGNCRGVVIHARTGNEIAYLSERWFELLRHCCATARILDMKIWLYDEDGYPSGNAGGKVQKDRPDLCQQGLCFSGFGVDPGHLGHAGCSAELLDAKTGAWLLRNYRHIDLFQKECSARFLQFTHEKYFSELGNFFGNTIEAIYTDDESFLVHYLPCFPFSPVLEEAYFKKFNHPLRDDFALLAGNSPESRKLRQNYFSLASGLFLENFIRPQTEWCRRHNVVYLGHLSGDEGPLAFSIRRYGSAKAYYRAEHVPSVDDYLCDRRDQRYLAHAFSNPGDQLRGERQIRTSPIHLYKLGASAAEQYAQGRFSCETLTFLGWDVTPDFIQRQMLFELGMGVNLITHHAYYYRVGGGTENDCPPSYFFQQPNFRLFSECNRTWTRIAELLARANSTARHLVIVPDALLGLPDGNDICTAAAENDTPVGRAETAYQELLLKLMQKHISFDIAEESELAVLDGFLRVGDGRYTSFSRLKGILLSPETEKKLAPFADNMPHEEYLMVDREILVRSRISDTGEKEGYFLNLSGRDLPLPIREEKAFLLCDPVRREIVFRGTEVPENFVLRDGCCVMKMPDSFVSREYSVIPFEMSIYAPLDKHTAIPLKKTASAAAGGYEDYEGVLPDGVTHLQLETPWSAEIRLDGSLAGIIYGPPHLLRIEGKKAGRTIGVRLFRGAGAPPPPEPRLIGRRGETPTI